MNQSMTFFAATNLGETRYVAEQHFSGVVERGLLR